MLYCRQDTTAAEESDVDSEATASDPEDLYDSEVLSDDVYDPSKSARRTAAVTAQVCRQTAEPLPFIQPMTLYADDVTRGWGILCSAGTL